MTAKSMVRHFRTAAIVLVLAVMAGLAFVSSATPPTAPPLLGIVRETEIRIAPEIAARLVAFHVAPGESVHQGELLAELSSPELSAAVEEARATLGTAQADRSNVDAGTRKEQLDISGQNIRIAEANLLLAQQRRTRAAALAAKDFASKQKLDESTASLKKAEADLALAQATATLDRNGPTAEERRIAAAKVEASAAALAHLQARLAKTTIRAPVDGVVGLLVAEPGEAISVGQPIMTLAVGQERWVTATIREDHLGRIGLGTPLTLVTGGGARIAAKVTELRPLGEFATWRAARAVGDHDLNAFLVRADPQTVQAALEPGMSLWLDPVSATNNQP